MERVSLIEGKWILVGELRSSSLFCMVVWLQIILIIYITKYLEGILECSQHKENINIKEIQMITTLLSLLLIIKSYGTPWKCRVLWVKVDYKVLSHCNYICTIVFSFYCMLYIVIMWLWRGLGYVTLFTTEFGKT
jgi:isoprenylcysteine carboxyl methyltransferase (ICMT) family protein YpbQ